MHRRQLHDGIPLHMAAPVNVMGCRSAWHIAASDRQMQGSGMKGSLYNREEAVAMAGMGGAGGDDEDEVLTCGCVTCAILAWQLRPCYRTRSVASLSMLCWQCKTLVIRC